MVFFWSNEIGEPIHVHIGIGNPSHNAAKVWLTKHGGCIVAHNKNRVPLSDINELLSIIQDNFFIICKEWKKYLNLDTIRFYV